MESVSSSTARRGIRARAASQRGPFPVWATSAAPDARTAAAADPACRQEDAWADLPDQSARNALACAMSELQQSIHTDDLPRMARTLALSRLTGHRSDLSAAANR